MRYDIELILLMIVVTFFLGLLLSSAHFIPSNELTVIYYFILGMIALILTKMMLKT